MTARSSILSSAAYDMKDKVLVIDDEYQVRSLLRRVLQRLGHDVVEAEDGDGVTHLIQHERPALVLLDLRMPKTDGIAALDAIRASDSSVAVIVVTGDGEWERVKAAMEHGASEYITKPLDLQDLELSITSHLERRRARHKPSSDPNARPGEHEQG